VLEDAGFRRVRDHGRYEISDSNISANWNFGALRAMDRGCFWAMLIVLSLLRRFLTAMTCFFVSCED